jgi:hypothetical protein
MVHMDISSKKHQFDKHPNPVPVTNGTYALYSDSMAQWKSEEAKASVNPIPTVRLYQVIIRGPFGHSIDTLDAHIPANTNCAMNRAMVIEVMIDGRMDVERENALETLRPPSMGREGYWENGSPS